MHDIPSLIVTGSYGLGIVGVLGMAVAYLQSSRAKNIITLLEQELAITKETKERLLDEREDWKTERIEYVKRIGALEAKIETLQNLITQAPQINKLTKDMVQQHQEVVTKLSDIAELLVRANQ